MSEPIALTKWCHDEWATWTDQGVRRQVQVLRAAHFGTLKENKDGYGPSHLIVAWTREMPRDRLYRTDTVPETRSIHNIVATDSLSPADPVGVIATFTSSTAGS